MSTPPRRDKRGLIAVAAVGILLLLGAAAWLTPALVPSLAFALRRSWYESVVARINSGVLTPDSRGVVDLSMDPGRPEHVSLACVAGAGGGAAVFFPHWRGKGGNVEGVLYMAAPLVGGTILVPDAWPPGPAPKVSPVVTDLKIESVLGRTWSLAAHRRE